MTDEFERCWPWLEVTSGKANLGEGLIMTNKQARAIFDRARADTTDPDAIARIELCREYFTNPEFRKALADNLWGAGLMKTFTQI